jgi:hypothetical protein
MISLIVLLIPRYLAVLVLYLSLMTNSYCVRFNLMFIRVSVDGIVVLYTSRLLTILSSDCEYLSLFM